MASERTPPRIIFLVILAFVITMLLIMTCTALWKHKFLDGFLFLAVGAALTYIFFRKRLPALVVTGLGMILALAGLGFVASPSAGGLLLTLGSAVGGYLFVRWQVKNHPDRAIGDWKTVFDNEPKR